MRVVLLFSLLATWTAATWFEENVYKDSKRVVEDVDRVSREETNDLLSVLLNLDKLYGQALAAEEGKEEEEEKEEKEKEKEAFGPPRRRSAEEPRQDFVYDEENTSVWKRVLPPLGELCRVMHMRGCSHSRHR